MLAKAVLFAALATAVPVDMCDNMMVGDASHADRASQRYIETLAGPVKARFAVLAEASRCRQEDNRYAFELLLSKVSGGGRAILEHAAAEGTAEGRSVSSTAKSIDDSKCSGAVDRLRAADDRLLLLAEQIRS